MGDNSIFNRPVKAVNIGAELLGEALKAQGIDVIQLGWKPPKAVCLNPRILEILSKME